MAAGSGRRFGAREAVRVAIGGRPRRGSLAGGRAPALRRGGRGRPPTVRRPRTSTVEHAIVPSAAAPRSARFAAVWPGRADARRSCWCTMQHGRRRPTRCSTGSSTPCGRRRRRGPRHRGDRHDPTPHGGVVDRDRPPGRPDPPRLRCGGPAAPPHVAGARGHRRRRAGRGARWHGGARWTASAPTSRSPNRPTSRAVERARRRCVRRRRGLRVGNGFDIHRFSDDPTGSARARWRGHRGRERPARSQRRRRHRPCLR